MVVVDEYKLNLKECKTLHSDAIRKKRELIKMDMEYNEDTWVYRYNWQCPKCKKTLRGRMYRK